jgi:cytochrome c553
MKLSRTATMLAISGALLLVPGSSRAAEDGATLYNTKCAACHGVDGAGKPAANIPSLISDEARSASDEDLSGQIANGGPNKKAAHALQAKGLSPDHVKMILAYIRHLQKK